MTSSTSQPGRNGASVRRQDIRFAEKDEALRGDVRALGNMVGQLLLEQGGEALYKTVESSRQLAIARREGDEKASAKLDKLLGNMSAAAARDIVRAFSTYFQVVNTAEQVHRIRRRRDYLKDTNIRQPRSLDDTLVRMKTAGFDAKAIEELLSQIRIEPVFTPHPTETTRRTILRKHQNIVRRMVDMQNPALTPQESDACFESIRADITAIWQTEESPADGATVFDELEHTLFFMTDVIYRVIPPFYEALESALAETSEELDHYRAPNMLQFASWIGGDISDSHEITARIIRETLARQRSLILDLYYKDCRGLAEKLSQSISRIDVNTAVKERIESYSKQFPSVRGTLSHRYRNMPYRMLLRLICARLQATYDDSAFPYETSEQFIDDLKIVAKSLGRRKGKHAGLFAVQRLIRRAETFGFHFMSLDIRYNATDLQSVVGYCLGETDWLEATSEYRAQRIGEVLAINDSPAIEPDNDAKRLLSIFSAISYCRRKHGERAIGLFLIRHCRGTDDLLAALLLARWAGLHSPDGSIPLDIAPVFETAEELSVSAGLVETLLQNSFYRRNLTARGTGQTVMLSTTGSSSDGSIAASRWKMQSAHNELSNVFDAAQVDYTLFHGRGSFSGRGGVADSIACGHLRATEHGESVNERYGVRGIAFRTLEKAFSAVAIATAGLDTRPADTQTWTATMELLATSGDELYRGLTAEGPRFIEYFELATPIDVINQMRVSRAMTDEQNEAIKRDMPWNFAWAQSRHLLPSWYGFGTGLTQAIEANGIETLRNMIADWPFFRRLINDVETALAVADMSIAHHYSELSGPDLHTQFFPVIKAEYDLCLATILSLREQKILLENNDTLRRSIRLRNPYVDPMSLLQVELLQRWRDSGRTDDTLLTALVASVNGISRGLQTSV
jgi:phosphoenolpyruvate carboxylase